MMREYFHIAYAPHEGWVLSIMGAVQRSSNPILQQRWKASAQSALAELPLALVTKFEIMKVTIERLNTHIRKLSDDFEARPEEVQRHITGIDGQPTAYGPLKRVLPFHVVADLEAWIFGFRSTYEILYAFVKEFSSRILDRKVNDERVLKAIIHAKDYNTEWIDFLNDERNYFVHQTAPWFAIEVTGGTPKYEIVVLKRNTHDLKNPADYVRIEEYRKVQQGFQEALQALHAWMLEEIGKFESR